MEFFSPLRLFLKRRRLAVALIVALGTTALWATVKKPKDVSADPGAIKADIIKPSLSVEITTPKLVEWPQVLVANGNIAPWQEAIIGAEISNFRLTEVLVSVGDTVKKGQLMARISSDTVLAELAQSKAAVAEAKAALAEAKANADRTRHSETSNFFSEQQITEYLAAEQTALARVNAAKARMQADELRLAQTRVLAPDDGIISARTATVGSLTQPGQELFRLIRNSRLEWRAEVTAPELAKLNPGVKATLTLPDGTQIQGTVRSVGPTVDLQTRNGLVYVDLPVEHTGHAIRAGMFVRGEFELQRKPAMTLPQSSVLLRDGFSYVFLLADQNKVSQTKIIVGRRLDERVEVVSGIEPEARVVASGAGFLADGDTVRVLDGSPL
jgi:RND family efflux transporter MFP subunit